MTVSGAHRSLDERFHTAAKDDADNYTHQGLSLRTGNMDSILQLSRRSMLVTGLAVSASWLVGRSIPHSGEQLPIVGLGTALREWKAAGRCGYVGITSTDSADYNAMEAIIRREKPDFVQVDYSMDNRAAEKRILPAAADAGAAVLTATPFGRTSLFRAVKGKTLPDWAKDFDAGTWAQFFLKFLLGNKQVTAVIPGTGNADHMIDNLGAARGRLPDAQQRERMAVLLAS